MPRMHVTERLLSLRALNLHRLSIHAASCQQSTERRRGCWLREGSRAGVVLVSWGRVGSVGRFDRLWHTDGRPFVRGAPVSGMGQPGQVALANAP